MSSNNFYGKRSNHMFLNHFKMTDHPFQERPPMDWILRDPRLSESLARLEYFSRQGTLAVLIGQTGVGKSTLLRLFIHALSKNRYRPIYLHFTGVSPSALLRLIVAELGEVPKRGKDNLFLQILERCKETISPHFSSSTKPTSLTPSLLPTCAYL
jgi:general secretion pathway protein A